MKICKQCGKTAESEGNFCESCGGTLVEAAFCPHCGAAMPADVKECPACGKAPSEDCPNGETQNEVSAPTSESKPKNKLPLIIGIGAAVLAIAAIGTVAMISRSSHKSASGVTPVGLVYRDGDGKIYYLRNDKGEAARLARDGSYIDGCIIENGKTLLYAKDQNVYYLSLKDKDAKPKKITAVSSDSYYAYADRVQFSNNGTIAYTDDDGELFFGPYDKPESIDQDVVYFKFSAESGSLAYVTDDYDLYFMPKGREAERAGKDIDNFFVSKDGNSILFHDRDGDVHRKKFGKEKEKLASDAAFLIYADEKLSAFYYIDEDNVLYMQKGKNSSTEICEDTDFNTDSLGTQALVFRSDYRDGKGDLCIVSGDDYELVEEDVTSYQKLQFRFDKKLDIYYYSKDDGKIGYLFVKNNRCKTLSELGGTDSIQRRSYYDEENDIVYFADEYNLYSYSVASELSDKASVVSELPFDFDNYFLCAAFKGKPVVYGYDDNDDEYVALCWNGTEICEERVENVVSTKDYLYYLTYENGNGELYRFDGKNSELVAEDVCAYYNSVTRINDKLYYVVDYNDETRTGDLYVIDSGKKPALVAEDVREFTTVYTLPNGKTYSFAYGSYR